MLYSTFEWDEARNLSNRSKHGVTFWEASTVFTDPLARLIADPDHSGEEHRYVLLGLSINQRLLIVCHCVRSNDSIRIISARKANKLERAIYEELRYA